ncbi:MAG: SIMPL domain-containing protein [Saprospiraceae bacterium]|nr:SIMPL domain-containing protein [Saprospiraceae bacterium]
MIRTTFCLVLLLFVTVYTSAQVMGNYGTQQQSYQNIQYNAQYRALPKAAAILENNQLEITINALSNQKASSYTVIFNLIQTGKTADETNTLFNTRLDGFLNELKNLGIPADAIYVDMVNFLPKYEYDVSKKLFSKKTYTEIPKGFELQKNVHIRYATPALLDKIVSAAAHQEIYDIIKVDYFVKEPQNVYADLREVSFQYLNKIKSQYKAIGIQLDSAYLVTAENAWVAYPINRYERYQAFSSERIDTDEKNNIIVNNVDKPSARFYNAVPANDYDIVINPEILEPAVQFSYNLVVRYTLRERNVPVKTAIKKEFILVTPNGEVKSLKID